MKMFLQIGGGEIGVRSQFRREAFPERNNAHTKLGSDPNFPGSNLPKRRPSEEAPT
jgi:hypothetical protein